MEFEDSFAGRAATCAACERDVAIPAKLKKCVGCGRSLAIASVECPACGADALLGAQPLVPIEPDALPAAADDRPSKRRFSWISVLSFASGVAALGIWLVAGPIAFVSGSIALVRIRTSQGRLRGQRLAITGIWLAILGFFTSAAWWLVVGPFYYGVVPPVLGGVQDRAYLTQCTRRVQRIAAALNSYHQQWGSFPPAVSYDAAGRPMHSWRVLLLPHLGEHELYAKYRLSEPWDSVINLDAAESMPDAYRCPADSFGSPQRDSVPTTSFLAITGSNTAFPFDSVINRFQIRDPLRDTIVVAETSLSAIPWTQPEDMVLTATSPNTGDVSSMHDAGFHAVMADGAVRYFDEVMSDEELRSYFTISGGDSPSAPRR